MNKLIAFFAAPFLFFALPISTASAAQTCKNIFANEGAPQNVWAASATSPIPQYNLTFPELTRAEDALRKTQNEISRAESDLAQVKRKLPSKFESTSSKEERDEKSNDEHESRTESDEWRPKPWPMNISLFGKKPSPKKKLSDEEIADLNAQKTVLETTLTSLNTLLGEQTTNLKNIQRSLTSKAKEEMQRVMQHPLMKSAVLDALSYFSLSVVARENKVTVLVGNRESSLLEENPQALSHFKKFIADLADKNYTIIFEGSSVLAPVIADVSGKKGVAVFDSHAAAEASTYKNAISIVNDYSRMKTFAEARSVIVTPDSLSGMGLVLEGKASHVWNVGSRLKSSMINEWESTLRNSGRNLGVNTPFIQKVEQLYSVVTSSAHRQNDFLKFTGDNITFASFETVLSTANEYANVMIQNSNTGGAVVFGSSKHDKNSAALIYESSYDLGRLGYAVATGGAGGAMELSNAGAFNGGGVSIGIPITGRHSLAGEKTVASGLQTQTIETADYNERIPALLGEGADARKLVIFAPGGSGTIKELAATLVRLNKLDHNIQYVVFLDKEYYEKLVAWLNVLPIPSSIKQKFYVADSREEVELLGKEFQNDLERSRVIAPRKNSPNYDDVKIFFAPPSFSSKPWSPTSGFDDYAGYGSSSYSKRASTDVPPAKPSSSKKNDEREE